MRFSYADMSMAAALMSAVGGWAPENLASERSGDTAPSWQVALGYTADVWRNVDGGARKGDTVMGQAEFALDIEAGGGLRSRVHVIHNNGKSFSEIVGDSFVVSNIEADRATRLLEAWMEYAPSSDRRGLKLGVYNLNSEFDVSEVGGALINSTFGIGVDAAQSGVSGPSIFPYTGLALRGRWGFDDRWMVQGVIIDAVPVDPDSPRRFTSLKIDSDEGALWAGELERRGDRWRTVIGHWRYTASFEEFDGVAAASGRSSRNSGTYGLIEGPVWEAGDRRLLAMLRLGAAHPRYNVIGSTAQAALVLERPWLRREGEHFAIGLAHARNGRPARRLADSLGEPLTGSETVIEMTWRIPLAERLAIQPDVHYIRNPGSATGTRDAFATGLRIEIDLTPP
jgi:porin